MPELTCAESAASLLAAALARFEIVDLSTDVTLHEDGPFATRLDVLDPEPGARFLVERVVPHLAPEAVGRIDCSDLPDRAFLRHEMITLSTHAGSHIDAPGHYGPGVRGEEAINDAAPDLFIRPAVCFDAVRCSCDRVRWDDLPNVGRFDSLSGIIVLIRTGPAKALSVNLIDRLLDMGTRVIGVDAASLDGPFEQNIRAFVETHDRAALWPCHMLGRRRPFYQIENLTNLDRLPPEGFFVWAPPIRVRGATASWSRVIALVPADANGGSPCLS